MNPLRLSGGGVSLGARSNERKLVAHDAEVAHVIVGESVGIRGISEVGDGNKGRTHAPDTDSKLASGVIDLDCRAITCQAVRRQHCAIGVGVVGDVLIARRNLPGQKVLREEGADGPVARDRAEHRHQKWAGGDDRNGDAEDVWLAGHGECCTVSRVVALIQAHIVQAPNLILPAGQAAGVSQVEAELSEVGDDGTGRDSAATTTSAESERAPVESTIWRGSDHNFLAIGEDAGDVHIAAVLFRPNEVSGLNDLEVPAENVRWRQGTNGTVRHKRTVTRQPLANGIGTRLKTVDV